jgi:hypothetical protein
MTYHFEIRQWQADGSAVTVARMNDKRCAYGLAAALPARNGGGKCTVHRRPGYAVGDLVGEVIVKK